MLGGGELLGDMSDIIAVENNGMESETHTNEMEVMPEEGETMAEIIAKNESMCDLTIVREDDDNDSRQER